MSESVSPDVAAALAEVLGSGAPASEAPQAGSPTPAPTGDAPQAPAAAKEAPKVEAGDPNALPQWVREMLTRVHETERRLAAREKELETRTARAPEKRWTPAAIRSDLSGYLKTVVGVEPGEAARALMGGVLGDKSPPEYRAIDAKLRESGANAEQIEALREEFASVREQHQQFVQAQEQARHVAAYQRDLDTYVGGDLESTLPNAARAIRADRDGVMQEVWAIVREDARSKLQGNDPDASPITPQEALAVLERRLGRVAGWVTTAPAAPKTLANTVSGVPPVVQKPADSMAAAEAEAWDWFNKQ